MLFAPKGRKRVKGWRPGLLSIGLRAFLPRRKITQIVKAPASVAKCHTFFTFWTCISHLALQLTDSTIEK